MAKKRSSSRDMPAPDTSVHANPGHDTPADGGGNGAVVMGTPISDAPGGTPGSGSNTAVTAAVSNMTPRNIYADNVLDTTRVAFIKTYRDSGGATPLSTLSDAQINLAYLACKELEGYEGS